MKISRIFLVVLLLIKTSVTGGDTTTTTAKKGQCADGGATVCDIDDDMRQGGAGRGDTTGAAAAGPGAVMVTGANGFIGSWIVQELLQQHYTVHACVRDATIVSKVQHLQRLPHASTRLKLFSTGALGISNNGNPTLLYSRAMAGCTAVIHVSMAMNWHHPYVGMYRHTLDGTQQVLDALLLHTETVHTFLLTSSTAAVPIQPRGTTTDESHYVDAPFELDRKNFYAATKMAQENLVRDFVHTQRQPQPQKQQQEEEEGGEGISTPISSNNNDGRLLGPDFRYFIICPTRVAGPPVDVGAALMSTDTTSMFDVMTGHERNIKQDHALLLPRPTSWQLWMFENWFQKWLLLVPPQEQEQEVFAVPNDTIEFVHVQDLARMLVQILEKKRTTSLPEGRYFGVGETGWHNNEIFAFFDNVLLELRQQQQQQDPTMVVVPSPRYAAYTGPHEKRVPTQYSHHKRDLIFDHQQQQSRVNNDDGAQMEQHTLPFRSMQEILRESLLYWIVYQQQQHK